MTLPYEERQAIEYAREFLYDLAQPAKTKRIPKFIRIRAYHILKHYPGAYRISELFGESKSFFRRVRNEIDGLYHQMFKQVR